MAGDSRLQVISAVVCSFNPRSDHLERTLRSVLEQDLAPEDWELLVVDNASSPPIAEQPIVRKNGIAVVREERPGLTAAKERGAREARGDVVVFVDDDNVLDPSYLRTAAELFADERLGVVGPAVEPEYEIEPPAWFRDDRIESSLVIRRLPDEALRASRVPIAGPYFPAGAGSCVRRAILLRHFDWLGDDERIEGRRGEELSGGEDWDMGFFALEQGYLVGTCGALRLKHLIPPSRTDPDYMRRLMLGSLDSAVGVSDKWSPRFGREVVPYLATTARRARLKGLLYRCAIHSKRNLLLGQFQTRLAERLAERENRRSADAR